MYKISNVNSGDLITAAYVDSLVAAILDLNNRVAALEGQAAVGGQVTISSVTDPQAGADGVFRVQDMITVSGSNFSVPAAANDVRIGGYQIGAFAPGSGPNTLIFPVPVFPPSVSLDPAGTPMLLTVKNTAGSSAPWLLTVGPQVIVPTGALGLTYSVKPSQPSGAPADDLVHGNFGYQFGFHIAAHVYQSGNYVLAASISNAGWSVAIQGGTAVTGGSQLTFQLPAVSQNTPGSVKDIVLTVTPPNAGSGNATLSLTVSEVTTNTQVVPASITPIPITIGGHIPPLADVALTQTNANPSSGAIQISASNPSPASFQLTFYKAANYTVTFSAASTAYKVLTPMPLPVVQITAASLPASGAGVAQTQNVTMQSTSGAGPSTLTAHVTNDIGDPAVDVSANIQSVS